MVMERPFFRPSIAFMPSSQSSSKKEVAHEDLAPPPQVNCACHARFSNVAAFPVGHRE